jgi:uncharacterized repeat protein (TIGR03806 family)
MKLSGLVVFVALAISGIASAEGINIPLEGGVEPPARLSATGLFEGKVADLQPAASLRLYEINQPLWVDFAQKQRWIHLPEGTKITFSAKEAFGFPVGTILVKHFRMETSRNVFQNLETRVLVKKTGENNWVGYTYQWEGEDARLVGDRASPNITLQVDSTAFGGARTQVFKIPNRNQCLQCHHSSVGYARSVIAPQLNRRIEQGNQLEEWNKQGLFDRDIGAAAQYEAYAPIGSVAVALEERVKAYLAVNCAHCHNPDPKAICSFTGLDFRYDTFKSADLVASGHLVPGKKTESSLYQRMISVTPGIRMPYIGSVIPDEQAVAAVGEWIDGLQKTERVGLFRDSLVSQPGFRKLLAVEIAH